MEKYHRSGLRCATSWHTQRSNSTPGSPNTVAYAGCATQISNGTSGSPNTVAYAEEQRFCWIPKHCGMHRGTVAPLGPQTLARQPPLFLHSLLCGKPRSQVTFIARIPSSDFGPPVSLLNHVIAAAKQQQQAQVPTISFFASSVPGLHPSTVHQLKQQQQHQQQQHAMDVDGAHAGDGGPQAPTEQQQQQLESQKEGERERDNTAVLQQQQQQALQQVWDLLQQRPIWSAQLLKERAQLPHMQHALPQLCFKFKTGEVGDPGTFEAPQVQDG
eukprot:1159741-Pelagomonas_calceolata.AAC.10